MDTTVRDPLVGQVLDGRYRVESRLARGGMATVYEAVDERLDRTIALKVMHAGLAEDEQFVSRFIREAKAAARLSHPNVVAVFDQGADGGHVFLAMEYVAGRTLRDLMREHGRLSPRQALEVLEPVLAALGAAHHAGIVHRDVKPENVLLADDGRVKVADFGLARAVSSSTSHTATSGILMGTVAYLSPEQVVRGVADQRSDVYAAGILLYEMLTGVKPYDGETAIQVAYRHVHENVPAPSSIVPGLPTELDALVARGTCRDPDGRPADAGRYLAEVIRARRGLSDGELDVLAALPPGPLDIDHTVVVPAGRPAQTGQARRGDTGPLPSLRRRRRSRGWVALLVVLLLAVGLSGVAWYFAAGPGAYTTTPGLLNMTRAEAVAKADQAGFSLSFGPARYSENVQPGRVITTDPRPEAQIKENGTITAFLSKGPERHDVPAVEGAPLNQAKNAITTVHLSVGHVVRRYDDNVSKGDVIRTDPGPGVSLKRDAAVNIIVSKGVAPVDVPDVTGKPLDQAQQMLNDVGLVPQTVAEHYNREVPANAVISQSPSSGQLLKNSTVKLVVSKGPPLVLVPNVRDMKVKDAIKVLTDAGFQVEQQGTRFLDRVFQQSPGGGDMAPEGSTVTIRTF
ncbi:MAG: eukaryotic-like serine/threonine-protein kinase [Actinomycetota bacterium]|nr:eukaryotic-like serine/threonine-protein kinase [Actinomycetota bacterium]